MLQKQCQQCCIIAYLMADDWLEIIQHRRNTGWWTLGSLLQLNGSAAMWQSSQVLQAHKQEQRLCEHKPPTHIQADLSQVAIIKAYVCFPAFIFCVALKWRQPTVLCKAVHFEPAQCVEKAESDCMTFCNAQVKTYMCMRKKITSNSCTEGACHERLPTIFATFTGFLAW